MKKSIKNIFKGIKVVVYSILTIVICIVYFVIDIIKRKKRYIANNHRTDEAIVLGNGPSLNDIDIASLKTKGIKICCVNYFPLKKQEVFFDIKPEYLCLMDPGFFDYTIEAEKKDYEAFLDVLNKVKWKLEIIAPAGKRLPIENTYITYEWINTHKISYCSSDMLNFFLYKHNLALPGLQNVTIGGLYYFLTANFKKIYIGGVDMSDFKNLYVDENNRVYVDSTHSYGSTRYYYDEMQECGIVEFAPILGAYQRMFVEFKQLSKYAKYLGIEVVNLSINSYIDVFKKEYPRIIFNTEE